MTLNLYIPQSHKPKAKNYLFFPVSPGCSSFFYQKPLINPLVFRIQIDFNKSEVQNLLLHLSTKSCNGDFSACHFWILAVGNSGGKPEKARFTESQHFHSINKNRSNLLKLYPGIPWFFFHLSKHRGQLVISPNTGFQHHHPFKKKSKIHKPSHFPPWHNQPVAGPRLLRHRGEFSEPELELSFLSLATVGLLSPQLEGGKSQFWGCIFFVY